MKQPRIIFVGGGSVGHIAPSVAVWNAIQEKEPEAKALFLCADRPDDREFLTKSNVDFTPLKTRKMSLIGLAHIPGSMLKARRIFCEFKPDCIFSKGGYVSIPVCLVAVIRGIPIVIHESDVRSGRANALIGFFAKKVCKGFGGKSANTKIRVTGNPVRTAMCNGSKEHALRLTGLRDDKPFVLVTGGSQGALALNRFVCENIESLKEDFSVMHITGRGKSACAESDSSYWATEFVTHELADLYALADVGIARAGGGSISELAANGIASVLVPLEGVAHAHQEFNAAEAEKSGGFIMVRQSDMYESLLPALRQLTSGETSSKAKLIHKPKAAQEMANIILDVLAPSE